MGSKRKKRAGGDIQLAKAAVPAKGKSSSKGKKTTSRSGKTTKKTSSSAPLTLQLPNPSSPTFIQDSMRSISNLRKLCKNCLKYVQQADSILDTLFTSANSLHETGLLQKLMQNKGKNLTTGDWTTIFLTLMNTPLGSSLMKKPGDGNGGQSQGQLPPGSRSM